jgi:hypothetical protein
VSDVTPQRMPADGLALATGTANDREPAADLPEIADLS